MAGAPDRLPFAGTFHGRAGFDAWRAALDASGHAVATGVAYASQVVRFFTVRGGLIVRVRTFYDTAAYAAALGR